MGMLTCALTICLLAPSRNDRAIQMGTGEGEALTRVDFIALTERNQWSSPTKFRCCDSLRQRERCVMAVTGDSSLGKMRSLCAPHYKGNLGSIRAWLCKHLLDNS